MPDLVLVDGDLVYFSPKFGAANVKVRTATLRASVVNTPGSQKLCVEGDEKNVVVANCLYTSGGFTIPGEGTITIESLADNHKSTIQRVGGRAVLLLGKSFSATFTVTNPAKQESIPNSPLPDPATSYRGTGQFRASNATVRTD